MEPKMNVETVHKIDPSKVWFYHAMDLPELGPVDIEEGWDLRGRFDQYIGYVPLKGRTVLDVGAASGFLSFEADKRGAIVTSFDAGTLDDREMPQNNQAARDWVADELRRMHAGYDLAHSAFQSNAKIKRGSVYRLSKIVDQHEIVIVGQILVHLKDPWNALREAAACSSDTLIIIEGSFNSYHPVATFVGQAEATGYWHISNTLYRHWFGLLGFALISEASANYVCRHPQGQAEYKVWTFVARRKEFLKAGEVQKIPVLHRIRAAVGL
jgi:2-polyprenyl-3-methyl-5-hydroxy-6-metoxy-1,4-benzoquinol methylase